MRSRALPFRLLAGAFSCGAVALTCACAGVGGATPAASGGAISGLASAHSATKPGLGAVLTSKGGQIFGFDINSTGNDGILSTATSIESFDQDSGAITGSFPKRVPHGTTYSIAGITTGDVALAIRYIPIKSSIYARRAYNTIAPPTQQKFTGTWTPPLKDIQVELVAPNQTAASTALYSIELKKNDVPDLIVSNVAKNTFSKVVHLDPNFFSLGNGPQLAQDTKTNQAVFALSPDYGRVGGDPPLNVLFDMKTGKETQFNGLNNGYFHAGSVNGAAVDSNTGIFATDTELNAQVEFYNLAKKTGTFAQLPCTGDTSQLDSGSGIASDSTNGLFIVTEQYNACGSGSAIVVYDEQGTMVETITGFTFYAGEPAPVINPSKRMGWVFGPSFNQLQQFFY
ncbi:MAG: hypothetical protein ABI431_10055 [Candidatus Tumulicola sp.]